MARKGQDHSLEWRFLILVSVIVGGVFAGLTIFGWIHGWEGPVALVLLFAGSFLVVHRGLHRPIRHGFSFGFLSGLIAMELQALFLTLYFAYNPEYELIEIPFGLPARLATAIFAPVNAMIAGLFAVGLEWFLSKIWNRAA